MAVQHYLRVAFLADSGVATNIIQIYTPPPLFEPPTSCVPDPDPVGALKWQLDYSASQGYTHFYSVFHPARGIYGWRTDNCVNSGDGTYPPPGSDTSLMSNIATTPVSVQIGGW
jgi:hypothetical protein